MLRALTIAATACAALGAAACSDSAPAPATPSATPARSQPGVLRIAAESVRFTTSALQAPAGIPLTLELHNDDAGVPHNIHVFAGASADDPSIGATPVEPGPVLQELALGALNAGAYYFQCDVHPTGMAGNLTVS
jgi:plastocyanin